MSTQEKAGAQLDIDQVLATWTAAHQAAAHAEGWDLWFYPITCKVQVGCFGDALPDDKHLPSDEVAMAMVRCGTGEHHSVARKIIHDHFPAEWQRLVAAHAAMFPAKEP